MRKTILGLGAAASVSALFASMLVGCGSDSGSAVCDVDFASLAGTYSFSMTTGQTRYTNSCFEDFTTPEPDPATMKNCTWLEEPDKETFTVELVVTEDGNIGEAKITSITDGSGQPQQPEGGVKCELVEGEICNAPIRCTITGQKCSVPAPAPDDWKFACNCLDGSMNDPASQVCLDCKAAYDKYQTESQTYCQKQNDSEYFEFRLTVK